VQEQRIEPHVAPPQAEASSSPQAAPPVPSAPPSPKITIHPDTAVNPDTAALAQRLLSSSIPPTPGDELDDKLVETSKNLANRLPLMISDTHRIDGTIVQHHKMIFRVTVTDIDAKSASGFFPSDARPVFQQLLCPTLSEGETVEIQFSGSDGTSLRNITIDQTSCGEASDKGQMNLRDVLDNL
jgi:hypothetical protein